jgi:hypothetical protein
MNNLKDRIPGAFDPKKKKISKWLISVGAILIFFGAIVGWVLIENGAGQLGRYIMRGSFIVAFVSLFINAILMFKAE